MRHGTLSERSYTPKLAGLDDLGSSLITLTVDLAAYRDNLRLLRDFLAPAKLISVVKANAYGFGVAGLLPILSEFEDVSLGVATPDEALELKALGWPGRIILLGYTHPKCFYQIVHSGCQLSAYRPENIAPLAAACREMVSSTGPLAGAQRQLELHIKVDTGMARLGVSLDELPGLIREVRAQPELHITGLFSHMVNSSDPDAPINAVQERLFQRAIEIATTELGYRPECHLANSGGALNFPGLHLDSARIGLLQFGVWPDSGGGGRASLRANLGGHGGPPSGAATTRLPLTQCCRLSSEVIDIHRLQPGSGVSYCHSWQATVPTTIATLPFGYADGMPWNLANTAEVLIGGRRCPLRGNIAMDYVMADLGDMDVQLGDEAVFIGSQGGETITLEDMAAQAGTIPYELSCRWGRRVRRVYEGS